MEDNIILHDFVLLLRNRSKKSTPQFLPEKVILSDYATKNFMSYREGVGHVISTFM